MLDYLVYDEFGLKEVLCICCGKKIKSRMEIRSSSDKNVIIREVAKHADYREIPMLLESGQIAFIMICDDCKFKEMDAKDISDKLNGALRVQLQQEGKLPDMIDAIISEKRFCVVKKADVTEVMAVLKGN